jgi:DNA polymerase III delta prime subunit
MSRTNVIPWVEKYRPQNSAEVCGNILEFNKVMEYGRKSKNLLLYGPSGTGKSTAIRCLLKNIPSDSKLILDSKSRSSYNSQQLTQKLNNFSNTKTSYHQRFVLVDEVDSIRIIEQKIFIRPLTNDIGNNIKRNIIFLFICNRIEKVSEFIVRNCVKIPYNSLSFDIASSYLKKICINEDTKYDELSLKYIFKSINCDMRKMVTTMQFLYFMTGKIDKDDFIKIDPLNSIDFHRLFERIIKNPDIDSVVDELYSQSFSILALCIYSMNYHKNVNALTDEYLNLLANLCNDSYTTEYTWFILYRLINESPLRKN